MSKKTIVGELKDLFVKFGGNLSSLTGKETTADMIDAIEQVYTGGGEKFGVNITFEMNESFQPTNISADKTMAEITAAYNAGKEIVAYLGESTLPTPMTSYSVDGVTFTESTTAIGTIMSLMISISTGEEGDTYYGESVIVRGTPVVTSDDNGKVMTVVDGSWNKADLPNLVVTYTEDNGAWTADKTYAEILTAYNAGKTITAKADLAQGDLTGHLEMRLNLYIENSAFGFSTYTVDINTGVMTVIDIAHSSADGVGMIMTTFTGTINT